MNRFLFIILCLINFSLSGCTTKPQGLVSYPEPERVGVYHKVKKGETIWKISKAYGVSIPDIIRTNNIPDVAQIEQNQLVFIPGAVHVKEIIFDTSVKEEEFIWPLQGDILSHFRQRKGKAWNKGIDIRTDEGGSVKAARSGEVVFADYLTGYGYMIILDHQDGFHSVYAQNEKLLVALNANVKQGEPIAMLNKQGDYAFLHFEIRRNSIEDNPLYYLP